MHLNGERNVADMGCGFGEVSRLLKLKLPKACFYLVNINSFQMSKCPSGVGFIQHEEDMCNTSIPDESCDLVMFNWSICHVDLRKALGEAYRISRPNGKLFVYDYERQGGDNELAEKLCSAHFFPYKEFKSACDDVGWRDVQELICGGDDTIFREAFGNDKLYDAFVCDLIPVIWTARK